MTDAPEPNSPPTCACKTVHGFDCQFLDAPAEFKFDGHDWCRFHLPLQDAVGSPSPKAGWSKADIHLHRFTEEIFSRLGEAAPFTNSSNALGNVQIDRRADFRCVTIPQAFYFDRPHTSFHVNFDGARFGGVVNFNDMVVGNRASFNGAHFQRDVSFKGAVFGNFVHFNNAIFFSTANFEGAQFGDGARFSEAEFKGLALFDKTTFGDIADFTSAKFYGNAWFTAPTSKDPVFDFRRIRFYRTTFKGKISFENRAFATSTSFDYAIFEDAPIFHDCKFHPGMSFNEAEFRKTKVEKNQYDWNTAELEQAYRTLKLGMETLRARNEEAMFFALEMESRRQRSNTPRTERLAATLYKYLSDYGRSLITPLGWLVALTVFAFVTYALMLNCGTKLFFCKPLNHGLGVFEFTFDQILHPFEIWSSPPHNKPNQDIVRGLLATYYRPLVPIVALVQSLATFGLLALFLLALRRRFKMD